MLPFLFLLEEIPQHVSQCRFARDVLSAFVCLKSLQFTFSIPLFILVLNFSVFWSCCPRCCGRASGAAAGRGCPVDAVCRLLIAGVACVANHGLQGLQASVVAVVRAQCAKLVGSGVARGLSCPEACGIFLDQPSKPYPLNCRQILYHWTIRDVLASFSKRVLDK